MIQFEVSKYWHIYNINIDHDRLDLRINSTHNKCYRHPQRETFSKEMYNMLTNSDGFDTLSAQPNSPNDVITSKSQLIMMVFSVRSIGKCNLLLIHRRAYSA